MASADLPNIAQTLNGLATPGMKPKELMKAVRAMHPQASKKDVVRAAFYSVIAHAGEDAGRDERLHEFALQERASPDEAAEQEDAAKSGKRRKKFRSKDQ